MNGDSCILGKKPMDIKSQLLSLVDDDDQSMVGMVMKCQIHTRNKAEYVVIKHLDGTWKIPYFQCKESFFNTAPRSTLYKNHPSKMIDALRNVPIEKTL